jgi:integrase
MTLDALLRTWWARESPGWARSNRIPRANLLDVWVVPYLGAVPLRELGSGRIADYRAEILAAGCTPKQANKAMQALSAALGAAVRYDLLPANPCARVRRLRAQTETPRPRAITPARVEALRAAMSQDRDRLLVSILFYCGLRPGEALALRWGDVNERTVTVDRAFVAGELKSTKTHRRRAVALIPTLAAELAASRPNGTTDDDLVVPNLTGGFLDLNNWRARVWSPAVKAAGLGRLVPYDGRHTFASLLIHEGRSVLEVAAQLGHESASTTLRHYAHLVEETRDGERLPMADAIAAARSGSPDVPFSFPNRQRGHLRLVS